MRKIDMITELYQRTLKELTSSNRAWMDFLKTAAFQYDSVYRDYELPSRASNVYRYLCDRANSDGQCWPSERTIAMDLKISRSTVKRAVEDLKRCGYITVERRYRKNGGNSSLLFVLKDFSKRRTTKG